MNNSGSAGLSALGWRLLGMLGSLKLTLVILAALGVGVIVAYQSETKTTWALVLPLSLCAVNLLAAIAIATVDRIFQVPGESFIGILDALADFPAIDLVTCRHEAGAGLLLAVGDAGKAIGHIHADHVIINGRVVMLDRRLLTLNESVIKRDANAYREKIIKSIGN